MMYMTSRSLLVSLIFGWAVLHSAEGRPSMSSAVELSTCGDASTELYSVAEECISICRPILAAQNCSRNAACTCATARPVAVQACVQCQLDTSPNARPNVLARILPSKLHEYAELCGDQLTAQAVLRFDDDSTATANNATLQSRELLQNSCLYGVPEIAISPLAILKSGRSAWPFIAVGVLVLLLLFERHHHK